MPGGPVQFLPGQKRGSVILHCNDGYHYNVREIRNGRLRLQCRHFNTRGFGCRGTATLTFATGRLQHLLEHNHERDLLLGHDMYVRRVLVHKAEKSVFGKKARTILDEVKIRLQDPELASRFTRVRMMSTMYRAKSRCYPKIPSTLLYLGVLLGMPNMRAVCKTVDGRDYIFQGVVGNANSKTVAVVFASGRMLQFLQTQNSAHGDGTFKKRPRKPKCRQIFNITVKYMGAIFGVVRILMQSKKTEAYVTVFSFLKAIAPSFNPCTLYCDFEKAEMNGFRTEFPTARIVGCLWHYGVSVSKYARRIGLAPLAHQNDLVFRFIRSMCAVPLLPQYMMWTGVLELWEEVKASGFEDDFLPLFAYYEKEWQPRNAELSVFGVEDRTNNCSESDNHMLGNAIPQDYPNVFNLIGGFVQLEYLAWCDKVAADQLRPVVPARRHQAVLNDRRVRLGQQMLINRTLTPGQFLLVASAAIHGAALYGLRLPDERDSESEDDGSESGSEIDDTDSD